MALSAGKCSEDGGKKLFPSQVDGKINTLEFLEASKGLVKLIDNLGKAFSPLSSDITCNIDKIKKCYDKNPSVCCFMEDMIVSAKSEKNNLLIDALLWLRRTLHFIQIFLQNIVNDSKENECLKEHISSAYSQALEPYHGWVTRTLFGYFKGVVPNRSALLSKINSTAVQEGPENLLNFLKVYIESLAENIHYISSLYKEHNLDSNATV